MGQPVGLCGLPPGDRTRNLCCVPGSELLFKLHRRNIAECTVKTRAIVPEYPLEDKHSCLFNCSEMSFVNKLSLQGCPGRFRHGIVVAVPDGAHGLRDAELGAEIPVLASGVLAAVGAPRGAV